MTTPLLSPDGSRSATAPLRVTNPNHTEAADDAVLAPYQRAAPAAALALARSIIIEPHTTRLETVAVRAIRADYRAHLNVCDINGRRHAGLANLVDALGELDEANNVQVNYLSSDAGLVILVSHDETPLGLVSLPKRAG